jgi:hypothetical protein
MGVVVRLFGVASVAMFALLAVGSASGGQLLGQDDSRVTSLYAPCEGGTLMADVVQTTMNAVDTDATGTRAWAYDRTATVHYRIWQTSPGAFCVIRDISGTFETVSGTSPAGTATVSGGVTGTFISVDRLTFTGTFDAGTRPTQGVLATIDNQCQISDDRSSWRCPGASGNVPLGRFYFSSRTPSVLDSGFFLYRAGPHGNWGQFATRNIGDIVG